MRITAEDIEDENVLEIHQDFEAAWVKFLEDRPTAIVSGATADRIETLQKTANAVNESKSKLVKELKDQLSSIKKSRKDLERQYSPLLDAEKAKQDRLKESMEQKISLIQESMNTMEETVPFLHFLKELDRIGANKNEEARRQGDAVDHTIPPVAKPSIRAMLVANTTTLDDPQELGKACKIDNELYRAQLIALQKEIERYETISPLMEEAGQFLTEQNIWKIMNEEKSAEDDA